MPIPGLEDTYSFANWMKVEYVKAGRPQLLITPENGGLLQIDFIPAPHRGPRTAEVALEFFKGPQKPCICIKPFDLHPGHHHAQRCPRHLEEESLDRAIAQAEEMP